MVPRIKFHVLKVGHFIESKKVLAKAVIQVWYAKCEGWSDFDADM